MLLQLFGVSTSLTDGFHLHNINLELRKGEIHIIMGENGSGKSCLMQLISGDVPAEQGTVYLMGETSRFEQLRDSVVYIRQNANILQNLSVAENIFYNRMPYSNRLLKIIDHNKLNKLCADLIQEFDLPFSIDDRVDQLGWAQRQIIGFCRAFVSDAPIVILDEPSSSLTEHDMRILHRIMEKIREKKAGIFYVSHNLNEIREFGDRVSVLRKGELAGTLDLARSSDDEIIRLMSGTVLTNPYPRLRVPLGKTLLEVTHLQAPPILEDINIRLRKGEIIGITGLAGSGRTYLAHCLFGVHDTEGGYLSVNGRERNIQSPADAIDAGIALIPEDRFTDSLVGCLDVSKNLSLTSLKRFKQLLSINTTILNQVVLDYIRKLRIDSYTTEKSIREYTRGSQQKVALAKWIMKRSKVFILDEPTRSLDIPSRIDLYNSMNDLIRKGAGILFISSDIEEILGMCDRVLVLSDGRIVCNLESGKTNSEEILGYATGEIL
ncbi:MAG: sugar ABC transporter ATP-binding protein [Spirochaetales bacterium]|nr:sugar ABC transporter ATP-binding protein [Spirochaetales bacterium]